MATVPERAVSGHGDLCARCIHYYVTWDSRVPHGCRAMGFRSRKRPFRVVYESSGLRCGLYLQKPDRRSDPR